MLMACGLIASILYILERFAKYFAVLWFFSRRDPVATSLPECVSILQPILSGDPKLAETLEHNLCIEFEHSVEFIWLIDNDDHEADAICQRLVTKHQDRDIRMFFLERGGPKQSPKMLKLQYGIAESKGDFVAVLDDDTMLPPEGFRGCLGWLQEPDVGLTFGLPYYVSFETVPASFVSAFVDSNSLLTYVPYTLLTDPFTINGMFYLMRRDRLDQMNGFHGLEPILADDFAVAQHVRRHGFRLAQSRLRHAIYTHVDHWSAYFKLIRRWLVFPRESLMRSLSVPDQIVAYTLGLVPAILPLLILVLAFVVNSSLLWGALVACLIGHVSIVAHLNSRFLNNAVPFTKFWIVPIIQFLIPIQLVVALLLPQKIIWRGHEIHVERGGTFEIVKPRSAAESAPDRPAATEVD